MNGIKSLYGILSKNTEMQLPDKTSYKILAGLAVFLIMVPCCIVVGVISYVMTEALLEVDSADGGILFELQILSAFSMIFGVLVIFSTLFFSSDREHFVTLPIPAHQLMMGKFLYSYMAESVMEFLILISVFLGFFIAIGRNVGLLAALNPISIISAVIGIVLIPLVPLAYCAIFSLILMATLKGVKNSKTFYRISTVLLLLFAGVFLLSLKGIGEINVENYVESLGSGSNLLTRTLNVVFFTVPWLAKAVSGGSVVFLVFYLVGNVAVVAVLYFCGKKFYQEGLYTAASLGESKKAGIKENVMKASSPFKASLKKELRVILRTKAFSANCAYINLIWPVGVFVLFFLTRDKENMQTLIRQFADGLGRAKFLVTLLVIAVAFIATALNSIASTAFTREGQHLSLIKFIPVPYKTQMYAKAAASFIFTFPCLIIMDIVAGVFMHFTVLEYVYYAALMLFAHIISIFIGMLMDSTAPYIVWDDEYSALRGNLNTFFNMAVMMLIALVIGVIGFIIYELIKLPLTVFYIIMLAILLGGAVYTLLVFPRYIVINMKKL